MKLPKRSKHYGVGKKIGSSLYIHKQYDYLLQTENFFEYRDHLFSMFNEWEYTIIKYNFLTKAFSFIYSPDFDTADEPTVGNSMIVHEDGRTKLTKMTVDPWIYHHKWLMVSDNYKGFDVQESINRSIKWLGLQNVDSSRIGKKSHWEKYVVPRL